MNKTITCITCPVGCKMELSIEIVNIVSVSGNKCDKGRVYAENEYYNPSRVLTTTIYVKDADKMLPVRSDKPLPKDKIFDYVKEVKALKIKLPIKAGDVLKKDIVEGVNIIASCDI